MTNKEIIAILCKKIAVRAKLEAHRNNVSVQDATEALLDEIVDQAAEALDWEKA